CGEEFVVHDDGSWDDSRDYQATTCDNPFSSSWEPQVSDSTALRRGGSGGCIPSARTNDAESQQISPLANPRLMSVISWSNVTKWTPFGETSLALNKPPTCPFDPPPARQATRPVWDGRDTQSSPESPPRSTGPADCPA